MWFGGIRCETGCIHSIWYDGDYGREESGPEDCVLFAGIGDTNHMVDICQHDLKELVSDDGAPISESKEGVVGEHRRQPHGACVENALMT